MYEPKHEEDFMIGVSQGYNEMKDLIKEMAADPDVESCPMCVLLGIAAGAAAFVVHHSPIEEAAALSSHQEMVRQVLTMLEARKSPRH